VIYLVESVEVDPGDLSRYLDAFEHEFLPPAVERGMDLVACWHTPADLGEDVTVTTIFRLRDWGHWEELRTKAVLDPSTGPWVALRRELVRRGTRRFHTPAACSPMQ
jgi:hypothetical protein